jgi:hypothetical protein
MSSTIKEQIKQHFVAIVSLVIALTALLYTTWREEATERNRNTRQAAFVVLQNLGQLQVVINSSFYQPDNTMGNPMIGWGYVAIITDMSELLPSPVPEKAKALSTAWGESVPKLKTDEKALDNVTQEVDASREAVLEVLRKLR